MTYHLKRIGALITTLALTAALLPAGVFATGGTVQPDGTKANPYEIAAPEDFDLLRQYPDAFFELTQDIDMKGVQFAPVEEAFTGTLNGQGHAIKNLTINDDVAALFVTIGNGGTNAIGEVKGLVFENASITGKTAAAAVACVNEGYIGNVNVQGGSITATGRAGALAARLSGGSATVQNSGSTAAVTANVAGGLVGLAEQGTLKNSYIGGKVSGSGTEAVAGAVFGKTQNAAKLTLTNVLYSATDAAQPAIGYVESTDAQTGKTTYETMQAAGAISIVPNAPATLAVGDEGDGMFTLSAAPAKGYLTYAAGKNGVLEVDEATGAYKVLQQGDAAYLLTVHCGDYSYPISLSAGTATGGTVPEENNASSDSTSASGEAASESQSESTSATVSQSESTTEETSQASSDSTASASASDSSSDSSAATGDAAQSGTASASESSSAGASISASDATGEAASGSTSESENDGQTPPQEEEPEQITTGAWESANGNRYYVYADGTKATGKQLIDDLYYVFDENGVVYTYEFFYDGCWYIADSTGALYRSCFLSRQGIRTYYNSEGAAVTGWIARPNGNTFYQHVTESGSFVLATGVYAVEGTPYLFSKEGVQHSGTGWVDGVYLENGVVRTGMQTLDGKTYVLKEDGIPYTGEFTYNGTAYCADENGVVYLDAFRTMEDGTLRYYNADGQAKSGWVRRSEGDYYQSAALVILTGKQAVGSKVYFFGSDGKLSTTDGWAGDYYIQNGEALTGMQTLDGKQYYFDAEGLVTKGAFTLDDATYCGDENGALYQNAIAPAQSGAGTYYGADGKATTGWIDLDGARYYQTAALQLAVGKQTIDGEVYFFAADGKQQTGDGWAGGYYLKNGKVVTGVQTIEDALYIFSADGAVYKNDFTYRGTAYYADANGKLYTDTIRTFADGTLRYYGADGKAAAGWVETNGGKYYQSSALLLLTGKQTISGVTYYFADSGRMITAGWVGSYYILDGVPATGPQTIEGKRYIFSDLGIAYKFTFTYGGARYMASGTGVLYTNCFMTSGSTTTYYDIDGAARTGWITRSNGSKYYQTERYELLTGQQVIDGVTYFFGSNGKLSTEDGWAGDYYVVGGAAVTGIQTIKNTMYIFSPEGLLQKGDIVYEGATYATDAKGALLRETIRTLDDGTLRYYGAEGKALTDGWFTYNGGDYYQDKSLVLATGKQTISGKVYFFEATGALKTDDGWAGDYYVVDGKALTGMQEIEGVLYIFAEEGAVYKGDFTYDGGTYYADKTGAVLRDGIHAITDGSGNRYHGTDGKAVSGWIDYADAKYYQTEAFVLVTGKQTIEDDIYFFAADGALKTNDGWADGYYLVNGKVLTGAQELDGARYIFNADGLVQKDNFQYEGKWYCANETGVLFTSTVRTMEGGKLRCFTETGAAEPGFITLGDATYYQGTDAYLVIGRQEIEGKIYFFEADGALKTDDGWVDGYYLKDGKALTGRQTVDGVDYIFDATGLVQTGEFTYEGKAYYADEAGALHMDYVYARANGTYAYFDTDGAAAVGWAESAAGEKYYQTQTGGVYTLATGFTKIEDETYYFEPSGKLFAGNTSGWYTVAGKQYYILTDGRWCTPPAITNVTTAHDTGKGLYTVTIENTISTAAGVNEKGSFSFDGGATWQVSNVYTVSDKTTTTFAAGKIRVRDGVGQTVQYMKAITLAAVSTANSGAGSYGIDVSQYNGAINWSAVKASGINFAIIRATSCNNSGYYVDPYFETNVRNAKAAGIDVGLYIFSYARSYQDVQDEINFFLNSQALKNLRASGITFDYPVYIDYESNLNLQGTSYDERTNYVRTAMIRLQQAGYYPGFYTYHSYRNYFNVAALVNEGYDFWYARYPASPSPANNPSSSIGVDVGIWQYCSDGNTNGAMKPYVNGVYTSLDLNYVYKDYPTKVHAFYGTSSGSGTTPPATVTQDTLTVYDTNSGKVVTEEASSILAKIVQTEVGGFNNAEVYKAQAVAAHSYIMYQSQSGNTPTVALSTPTSSVTAAVAAVADKIVTYNGVVANTMYSAANSGVTQSSAAMWGGGYVYLQAGIASPGDLNATLYASGGASWQNRSTTVKLATMTSNVEKMVPGSTAGRTDYQNWITNPEYDANGYLTYITVMGTRIRAGKFYDNCWGLYSPNFTMAYNGNGTWTFVTRGNGHGVGMSQWGAYGYAKSGSTYDQILAHYYPGTALANLK